MNEAVNIKLGALVISVSKYDDIKKSKSLENGGFSNIDYKDAKQEDEAYIEKILKKTGVIKN